MNILYILSTYNIYGGTPKKTLDLIKHSNNNCSLYVYDEGYQEFKHLFENAGATVFEGYYKRNFFLHLKTLLKIIDEKNIQIIQTQFTMGEILGYLIKLFRPHLKLIVAFVGPFEPKGIKKFIAQKIYPHVDAFVFISKYVQKQKVMQFPILEKKEASIIFNGTEKRPFTNEPFPNMKHPSLYTTSGLVDWKNVDILVEAIHILKTKEYNQIYLYVVGDGPERINLENKIHHYKLSEQIFLLGYQKNIGAMLDQADIYVHPAYAEGFGIALAEAMIAGKASIVSNAGALPELIDNNKSGIIVDPFDTNAWVDAIIELTQNKNKRETLGSAAQLKAENDFSVNSYVDNYQQLYHTLLKTIV